MARRIETTVIDIRRFLDWAATREDLDPERVGLIGFSLGALMGSLVAVSDERVAATVLVMGAGNFEQVMANCEGRPGRSREQVMARFAWTREDYRVHMARVMGHLNPENFPGRVDPARVLVIDSRDDECMPERARDALWLAMGKPERISFHYGHKTSFLSMTPLGANYMRRQIYRFFERSL